MKIVRHVKLLYFVVEKSIDSRSLLKDYSKNAVRYNAFVFVVVMVPREDLKL